MLLPAAFNWKAWTWQSRRTQWDSTVYTPRKCSLEMTLLSAHLWAVTWPSSLSGCPIGLSRKTDEVEDEEPLPLPLFKISTVAPLVSRRRDRRIGDILSEDARFPTICPSVILTSLTLWGEVGGILVPSGGRWLSSYVLLFCLDGGKQLVKWSVCCVNTGKSYIL